MAASEASKKTWLCAIRGGKFEYYGAIFYDGSVALRPKGKPMRVVRTLSICAVLLFLVAPAAALNPDRDIHQLAHRSWGEKDGYPGQPWAMAQTTDGFLWLGTFDGLFRFDGIHFERSLLSGYRFVTSH